MSEIKELYKSAFVGALGKQLLKGGLRASGATARTTGRFAAAPFKRFAANVKQPTRILNNTPAAGLNMFMGYQGAPKNEKGGLSADTSKRLGALGLVTLLLGPGTSKRYIPM